MKRVSLSIKAHSHPDLHCIGYAITTEMGGSALSFFTTQKFPVDEKLEITTFINGEAKVIQAVMRTTREEISSGKVMNGIPDEAHPFPARTFYKCYAQVAVAVAKDVAPETESETAAPNNVTAIGGEPASVEAGIEALEAMESAEGEVKAA